MDIRQIGNIAQPIASHGERNIAASELTSTIKSISPPSEAVAAIQQPAPIPSMGQVTQAIKDINTTMGNLGTDLEFSIDMDSHRTVVKVVDQKTKELIRQMPTEEAI